MEPERHAPLGSGGCDTQARQRGEGAVGTGADPGEVVPDGLGQVDLARREQPTEYEVDVGLGDRLHRVRGCRTPRSHTAGVVRFSRGSMREAWGTMGDGGAAGGRVQGSRRGGAE